jgi:hypothetical protein
MPSKTKESGRADILLRMEPGLKARIVKAANEDGMTINDCLLDLIEYALNARDAAGAASKRKADLDSRRDAKYEAIVSALALAIKSDRTSSAADQRVELDELTETVIEKWRSRAGSDYHAEPKTPLERLCAEYLAIEDEIDGIAVSGIDSSFEIQIDDADPGDDELDDAPDGE